MPRTKEMEKEKRPLEVFKERLGPADPEVLERVKYGKRVAAAIRKSLKDGPKTVPEMVELTELPDADLFWYVNALKKYGEVAVESKDGSYNRYRLNRRGSS